MFAPGIRDSRKEGEESKIQNNTVRSRRQIQRLFPFMFGDGMQGEIA